MFVNAFSTNFGLEYNGKALLINWRTPVKKKTISGVT